MKLSLLLDTNVNEITNARDCSLQDNLTEEGTRYYYHLGATHAPRPAHFKSHLLSFSIKQSPQYVTKTPNETCCNLMGKLIVVSGVGQLPVHLALAVTVKSSLDFFNPELKKSLNQRACSLELAPFQDNADPKLVFQQSWASKCSAWEKVGEQLVQQPRHNESTNPSHL